MTVHIERFDFSKPAQEKSTSTNGNDTKSFQSNGSLEHHPEHASISKQLDRWMENNTPEGQEQQRQTEVKELKNEIAWQFWLRKQKVEKIWARTTAQAHQK